MYFNWQTDYIYMHTQTLYGRSWAKDSYCGKSVISFFKQLILLECIYCKKRKFLIWIFHIYLKEWLLLSMNLDTFCWYVKSNFYYRWCIFNELQVFVNKAKLWNHKWDFNFRSDSVQERSICTDQWEEEGHCGWRPLIWAGQRQTQSYAQHSPHQALPVQPEWE